MPKGVRHEFRILGTSSYVHLDVGLEVTAFCWQKRLRVPD
jgi:hypothetical protein